MRFFAEKTVVFCGFTRFLSVVAFFAERQTTSARRLPNLCPPALAPILLELLQAGRGKHVAVNSAAVRNPRAAEPEALHNDDSLVSMTSETSKPGDDTDVFASSTSARPGAAESKSTSSSTVAGLAVGFTASHDDTDHAVLPERPLANPSCHRSPSLSSSSDSSASDSDSSHKRQRCRKQEKNLSRRSRRSSRFTSRTVNVSSSARPREPCQEHAGVSVELDGLRTGTSHLLRRRFLHPAVHHVRQPTRYVAERRLPFACWLPSL